MQISWFNFCVVCFLFWQWVLLRRVWLSWFHSSHELFLSFDKISKSVSLSSHERCSSILVIWVTLSWIHSPWLLIFLFLGRPELDIILQMKSHHYWVEQKAHPSQLARKAFPNTAHWSFLPQGWALLAHASCPPGSQGLAQCCFPAR